MLVIPATNWICLDILPEDVTAKIWQGGFNLDNFIPNDPEVVNAIINLAFILYAESTAAAAMAFDTKSFAGNKRSFRLSEKLIVLLIS